eukprot:Nk52_evm65s2118 gene=Nk52_evmTU65s2118
MIAKLFLLASVFLFAAMGNAAPLTSEDYSSDYSNALHQSLLFYEAQRSGELPADNRVSWRMSAMTSDGSDNNIDLSGGYSDAGDYIKFGFPMAWSVTMMAWGVIENTDTFDDAGELEYAMEAIQWGTDYFIKCHPEDETFYAQVGDAYYEHSAYWGPPQGYTGERPSWQINATAPGTDLACETAAALAAASIVFESNGNSSYAETLLSHAKTLYAFGVKYQGKYSDSVINAQGFYPSSGFQDEMGCAAMWLYRATDDSTFLDDFNSFYTTYDLSTGGGLFSWDDKKIGLQVLAAGVTGESDYFSTALLNIDNIFQYTCSYTSLGLLWCNEWGPNRYAANMAFVSFALASYMESEQVSQDDAASLIEFGTSQVNYFLALGDNLSQSFVVGFGNTAPNHCHHEAASTPIGESGFDYLNTPDANPYVLNGGLVGGPGTPQDSSNSSFTTGDDYADVRTDYIRNEVAMDYNAGYQGALAFALTSITA